MTIENSLLDGISVDSADFRRILHVALGGSPGAFATAVGATDGLAHGVCGATQLQVSQSLTPAMSVSVAAGLASIRGSTGALGAFPFYSNAAETLTISAAHASQIRRDLIIAEIRPPSSAPRLFVVAGTPGTGTDPSLAAFPNCLALARVTVPAAASSITNADITDLRTFAGAYGTLAAAAGSVRTTELTRSSVSADTSSGANVGQTTPISILAADYPRRVTWSFLALLTTTGSVDIYVLPTAGGSTRRRRSVTSGQSYEFSDSFILPAGSGLGFGVNIKGSSSTQTVAFSGGADLNYLTAAVSPV